MAETTIPTPIRIAPRKKVNYVDNARMYADLKAHREVALKADKNGKERPRMSEYLGECFLKIAQHTATKSNFKSYTYKDDMISDGVENCLIYALNFDPSKSKNPFGYFTTVIHFAFIRRIMKEKKHTYIKYKMMEKAHIDGSLATGDTENMQSDTSMLSFENVQNFITSFDEHSAKRRTRRRSTRARKRVRATDAVNV